MAVSRTISKKAPSQSPVEFAMLKQHGGTHGKPAQKVGDVIKSGPMREKVMGNKALGKQ